MRSALLPPSSSSSQSRTSYSVLLSGFHLAWLIGLLATVAQLNLQPPGPVFPGGLNVNVTQLCPTLCDPMDYSPWNSPGQNTGVGSCPPSLSDLPNPGIKPRSSTLQADSLPDEPQGKPENTGVGSLSALQQIFLTQEWNWGLLHCRRILYQMSCQGSPSESCSVMSDSL